MEKPFRIRIAADGSLRLPEAMMQSLGWKTGSFLEVTVEGGDARLHRVEVDPFAEALRKPEPDAFERILAQQKKSQEEAFKGFEEKILEKPAVRPEDKPDYWR